MDSTIVDDRSPASPPPLLRLHLFGGFRVSRDTGPPLPDRWPRPSARVLVKMLAVAPGRRLHRDQVIESCWPDADLASAYGSLRVALHTARHTLEPELAPRGSSSYLATDGAWQWLRPDTVWIDADHAEGLAGTALRQGGTQRLAGALAAFTGELLPEDRYAHWAQTRRDRLDGLRDRVRLALAGSLLADGSPEEAAATARAVVESNPVDERAHRLLINAFLQQGLRREAVRQFHECREILATELGIGPDPETERLHLLALDSPGGKAPSPTAGLTRPAALRVPVPGPLYGRGPALAELLSPDAPPVQLLGGEAGLGKTRLVTEAARRAADDGTLVLWGAGHEAEGHTPYGAFVEALDGWLADRPPAERARVGTDYPELAALLPSLGQTGASTELSPEKQRDRLFRAAAGLLEDLADVVPVLVVLDDLHAADAGSFQLLAHLAERAAARTRHDLRFVVTYRSEELTGTDPRRAALDMLERHGPAAHIALGRLGREDCETMAADALGLPPGAPVPQRVWDLSLGNPLFALELARELEAGGTERDLHTPQGVRHLISARLARLTPGARLAVEVAAVAGGDAALSEVLEAAAALRPGLSTAQADADAAVAASVLTEREVVLDGQLAPGLAFRHPLVRLTCYENLSVARRRLLHSAYAGAVLHSRPDAVDRLALHFARADDPRATGYLRQAAERAAALCANDTADHYYAELTSRLDALAADAAWARIGRSAVLQRMARYDEAAQVLREAVDDLKRSGDADGLVLATARLAEVLGHSRAPGRALALLDARLPDDGTSPPAATVHHVSRARLYLIVGRYADAAAAARRARASAEQVAGPERRGLLARALSVTAVSLALDGRFTEAGPIADEALPHAEAYGDTRLLCSVLSVQREQARRSGRLREALATGLRAAEFAERSGDPAATAFERANVAEIHLLLDEPDDASALALAAVESSGTEPNWSTAYAKVALARVHMYTASGDPTGLLEEALRTAAVHDNRQAEHEALTVLAEWHIRQDRPAEALSVLDGMTGTGRAHIGAWAHLTAGRPERAATLARAEVGRAEETGECLAEIGARTVLAASLAALGRAEESAEGFATASALAARLPYPAGLRRIEQAKKLAH
ncbi:AAA family ATPase [Streptomyces sp. NBC_00234]|uniref:BTAD domain-containing putative transcriptional regulator n=1 Tax=Streptomyces sp. NBC_00234 TaxID=2903638 RepID=UPI002E2BA5C1|nr:BTAD domain-containing putative transcriptional regulator [Streptomyces sp. NBC_00234]